MLPIFESQAAAGAIIDAIDSLSPYRGERLSKDAPTILESAYQTVEAGHIATGVEFDDGIVAGKGWAVAVLDQPVETVWMAVNDENAYAGKFGLTASSVIAGPAHGSGRFLFQYLDLPIISDRWWISLEKFNSTLYEASHAKMWEMSWTDATDPGRLAGTPWVDAAAGAVPVAWTKGAWMLVPLDDRRTLVEYFVWTDPGGHLPAGPASRFASGALDGAIRDLGDMATSLAGTSRAGYVRPDGHPL